MQFRSQCLARLKHWGEEGSFWTRLRVLKYRPREFAMNTGESTARNGLAISSCCDFQDLDCLVEGYGIPVGRYSCRFSDPSAKRKTKERGPNTLSLLAFELAIMKFMSLVLLLDTILLRAGIIIAQNRQLQRLSSRIIRGMILPESWVSPGKLWHDGSTAYSRAIRSASSLYASESIFSSLILPIPAIVLLARQGFTGEDRNSRARWKIIGKRSSSREVSKDQDMGWLVGLNMK